MIDTSRLNESWGWETTSTPGVVKKKQGGTSAGIPTEETTYTLPSTTGAAGTTGGGTMANNEFKYPSEWGQAGDVWSQMAGGQYTNTGMDWLKNLMQSGGSPVDVNAWGAAQQPAMMDQYSNMVKQMAEQAGVGGTRYGSGLQGQIANYGGQLQNQFQSQLADKWLQAQEAGMGRASGAGNLLAQLGLGTQQTGAEGLMGLGGQKAQLPLQVASQMSGMGGQLNSQDAMWAQLLGQLTGNTYAGPQTYQPTGFQDILQGLSSTLPESLSNWDAQGWW